MTVSQQDPIIINDVIHDGDTSSQEDEVYFQKESAKVKHKVLRPINQRGVRSDLLKSELLTPNRQQRDRSPVYEEIHGSRVLNGHGAVTRTSRERSPGRRNRSRSPGRNRSQLNSSPASFIDLNNHRDVSPAPNGGFTMVVKDRTSDTHLLARSQSPHRREPSPYRTVQVTHSGSYLNKQDPSPYRSHSPYRRDKSPLRNNIDSNDINALLRDLDTDGQRGRQPRHKDTSPSRSSSTGRRRDKFPAGYNSLARDQSPYRSRQIEESPQKQRQRDPSPRRREHTVS